MKEIIEEYGGIIVAAILGLLILAIISSLISSDGELHRLMQVFFNGIGAESRG